MKKEYPQISYGAVYFRKSNPPREDWERDYKQAAADGMNSFRHWFMWGAIETSPGVFDWEDYGRQMELAEKYGIKTYIAEFAECVPEWFFRAHPECFSEMKDGTQAPYSTIGNACATGGFVPGKLCMDNPTTREYVERFLRMLAERYKGHPALFAYDVWNECNFHPDTCYCEHTQKKFRLWLEKKYGSPRNVAVAWHRYSFAEWEDVMAPRHLTQAPECMDWLAFRKDNYYENYKWRADVIRSVDPDVHIVAHGVAASLDYTYGDGNNDWRAAEQVECYGMTWVMGRKGTEPWKQWQALDLLRSASRGKPFFHAEMQGSNLWLQPQVIGREKEDGRSATPADVRLWNLASLAGGAKGILYLRWRSLLDGPLFDSFGLYSLDGGPNDRSKEGSAIAKWANSEKTRALFAAKPVKGSVGVVCHDKIQEFSRVMQQAGPGKFYARCMWGAYRMFFDRGIPVDFVRLSDIAEYKTLYFPYPIQLDSADAAALAAWVKNGGTLISEGMPGYFGDGGTVGTYQPHNGLDEVFGVREEEAEFMPDIGDRISFEAFGVRDIPGGFFRQSYRLQGASLLGCYPNGQIAATVNTYGKGKAILVGTYPSEGYYRTSSPAVLALVDRLVKDAGVSVPVEIAAGHVKTRVWEGGGKRFLWLLNHDGIPAMARLSVAGAKGVAGTLWGDADAASFANGEIVAHVPAKNAVVLELK